MAIFGCGTNCIYGAAVSLKSGRVLFLPGSISSWYGEGDSLEYRLDSRLLIAKGEINEGNPHGLHYYEFNGKTFRHIKTIPVIKNIQFFDE